jgi:hypothetical protein
MKNDEWMIDDRVFRFDCFGIYETSICQKIMRLRFDFDSSQVVESRGRRNKELVSTPTICVDSNVTTPSRRDSTRLTRFPTKTPSYQGRCPTKTPPIKEGDSELVSTPAIDSCRLQRDDAMTILLSHQDSSLQSSSKVILLPLPVVLHVLSLSLILLLVQEDFI